MGRANWLLAWVFPCFHKASLSLNGLTSHVTLLYCTHLMWLGEEAEHIFLERLQPGVAEQPAVEGGAVEVLSSLGVVISSV